MIVKKVGVLSVARVYGALSAAMGLLFGLVLAAISVLAGAGGGFIGDDAPGLIGAMFGAGAVIFLPIFYGFAGLVMGAVAAALYNVLAGVVGGVSIEVE